MSEPERPRTLMDWLGLSDAPNWWVARPLGPLVTFVLSLLILGALAAAFRVLWNAITGAEVGLGSGGLIVAVLGAPFLIWSTWLKHRTVEFQKEGHMTDRISKAVEQLGAEKTVDRIGRSLVVVRDDLFDEPTEKRGRRRTLIEWKGVVPELDHDETIFETGEWKVFSETVPNLEVRIGAILSLERIAQDSTRHDKGRDHVRVMEILCAYIRDNSLGKQDENTDWAEIDEIHVLDRIETFSPPRADIQIALNVLGHRWESQITVERNHRVGASHYALDLSGSNLRRARLADCNFAHANFQKACLDGARLTASDFRGANLNLVSAVRVSATRARFDRAHLRIDFSYAILDRATFEFVDGGEMFASLNGRSAKFHDAQLIETHLKFTISSEKNISWGIGANFTNSRMVRCVWEGYNNSHEHDFPKNFHISNAREGFAFINCQLSRDFVDKLDLNYCFSDASTSLPSEVQRPDHWPAHRLGRSEFNTQLALWRAHPATYTPPPPPDPRFPPPRPRAMTAP